MVLQNLHTHTTYCDGANTPEELVKAAIDKGFSSLGFSGHSYMSFDTKTGMNPKEDADYKAEIKLLKEKYKGIIDIYTGLEFELFSEHDIVDYDYVIGACHYLNIDGEHVLVDRSPEGMQRAIDNYFGGDELMMCREYYRTFAEHCSKKSFDIIGHFDVITRNHDNIRLFDTESPKYRSYALEALHAIAEKNRIFELNTGAMARTGRKAPYPQDFIIKEIKNLGLSFTVGSDCHRAEHLDVYFKESFELLDSYGFKYIMIFDGKDFVPYSIRGDIL